MAKLVLSAFPMIDPETYREVLADAVDEPVEIEVAELGSTERLIDAASGADAVVTDINTPVTEAALDATDLDVVVRSAVGVDNIDVEAAAERGVTVTRVPDYCTDEVATHSVTLLLACLRSLKPYDDAVAGGGWSWEAGAPIRRVSASTIGLLSFGPIAQRAAEQLSGFDADLVAYDPFVGADEMAEYGVEEVDFEALFDRADHVGVYAPLTDATRGIVDADALARLDEDSVVVNVSRGPVVDADALLDALEADEIKAAGLDVLAEEPPEDDPLVGRDDTVVTPHAAWYSEEAKDDLNRSGAADVAAVLNGETPAGRVDPDADWL
ncbi:C-terminal binding protein [Halorubrum ezzemoulense]|jgi:D-3-phosphoglycerate dehydrogenase|uniref:3-phosphoglycerate dehydrogenase n=1 Tax=Halorubrum ezzemoulense TaxID=337243 RepID=A0A256KD06_HALEZ|nr:MULTISPECIES: C-terminal binding protein [Halorubrum]MDB2241344.1 C-terminal binding protein [Halorubrum ezzemoulense]MDB2245046.1 C-terminal binding protein [Halorubrum ezzemoulense]MDB2252532.1 C-terminal binding protein [Halorubrum ezzemoulense]MDB2271190.1 C-terminal binding protein [Halorubrum ezzemoulense]MDB2278196.1 C-terminal binding protein [Halorubrum ezzemoulense]